MVNWFNKKKVAPMHVMQGDTIVLTYTDRDNRRSESVSHTIDKSATYDTLAVGEVEDEFGFAEALIGVIGKEGVRE